MNCEDFKNIIDELADYKPMQAAIRDAGVSHAALCAECAAQLEKVRAVSSGLLLAASAESEAAPARVKENLLAAFAEVQRDKAQTANVIAISSRRRPVWFAVAAAVAAVILLVALIPFWKKVMSPDSRPSPLDIKAGLPEASPSPQVVERQPSPAPVDEKLRLAVNHGSARPRTLQPGKTRSAVSKPSAAVAQNAGEYLPLTYLANETAMDSGTVVRVELSRSALASLGFPVNVDGSEESVKAEVILGDDGVARAIRLLQQ